jgi:short-subunit dehydrogenase
MVRDFANRVAIVTGASSGIGWELARQLAKEGYKLGIVARREQPLLDLAAVIASSGGTAIPLVADVGSREQVEAAFAQARERLGSIDLVVANAGIGRPTLYGPVNFIGIEDTIRINLMGVIYTLSAALPDMLSRKSGHLVAVSSLAAYRGMPGQSAYCASKAGVNAYLDGLRIHLRGTGVRVTTICPGFVTTPMTESHKFWMPQLMTPEYAAAKMVRAIKAGKKVYNFPRMLHLLVKLSRWAPDWVVNRVMGDAVDTQASVADSKRG